MKKLIPAALAIMLSLAMVAAVMAAGTVALSDSVAVKGFAFHCGTNGGNGKTYLAGYAKDFGKYDKKTGAGVISLTRNADDPKAWDAVVPAGEAWACLACGSAEWVSYSNKSGVPDGKNIQLFHPAKGAPVDPPDDPPEPPPEDIDEPDPEPVIEINIAFVGWYPNPDPDILTPLQTSIHWQFLTEEGDEIDWSLVDAAYADWAAKGGYAIPANAVFSSSGALPLNFARGATIAYGTFTPQQREAYYSQEAGKVVIYLDPGYVLPW